MAEPVKFKQLRSEHLVEMIEVLGRRVEERFPGSDLSGVAGELTEISRLAKDRTEWISKPIVLLRMITCLLLGLIGAGIITTIVTLELPTGSVKLVEFVQVFESGINDIILIGLGVFFIGTLEVRIKRARALKALHELRSIAHIIDMHQLTKDPQRLLFGANLTLSSPRGTMSSFELGRYLDYCSEMLALTGKIAALYVERFNDPVALSAVNEVETLTTGLSRKIWQKLMILNQSSVRANSS